jgi:hypothetical protein
MGGLARPGRAQPIVGVPLGTSRGTQRDTHSVITRGLRPERLAGRMGVAAERGRGEAGHGRAGAAQGRRLVWMSRYPQRGGCNGTSTAPWPVA